MRINNNISALNALRNIGINTNKIGKTTGKLASGLRINNAADDAAGLSISEKMRAQIRGLGQASRNIQDGISLIQTAEGGLNEVHSLLQRGRELSVQAANDTLTKDDKGKIQDEIDQIKNEVDRIANNTEFNTIKLLNAETTSASDKQAVIDWLQKSWLKNAENLIKDNYGLTADNANLKIELDPGSPGGVLAFVQYNIDGSGKGYNLELHVDMSDFVPVSEPNGGTAPYYNDRILAHELVHATMSRTMNFASLPTWFKEGAAEFIHGADERVVGDGGTANAGNIANTISGGWVNDSIHYSGGYTAVRYLHDHIQAAGGGTGIKEVFDYLKNNPASTLDDALKGITNGAYAGGLSDFVTEFTGGAGKTYIEGMNLSNADTGSIGGLDADGGTAKDAAAAVPDNISAATADPLSGFTEIWPVIDPAGEASVLSLQIGANASISLEVKLSNVTSDSLAISSVDVTNNAQGAIEGFDNAIERVSYERSRFGAIQNRLEHALMATNNTNENLTASESRIRDADMAKEMMKLSKDNILSQAAQAMLASANQQAQSILKLIV